jgi:Domain of Unknown Function with PDB structure (DUF3863)
MKYVQKHLHWLVGWLQLTGLLLFVLYPAQGQENKLERASTLMGNRFLTLNCIIRVNQIEVSRDRNVGEDERALHTPAKVIAFRNAVAEGFPGGKMTWAFS